MKLDLSSQIILEHIPSRYYQLQNEFETRQEKLPVKIYESEKEASSQICTEIAKAIRERQTINEPIAIAVQSGNSLQTIYQELIRVHREEGLSFQNVILFNLYEYYPLQPHSNSSFSFLKSTLIDHINIPSRQIYTLNGRINKEVILSHCLQYEEIIARVGGIDFMLLGLSESGNIGINMLRSGINSSTRLVMLDMPSKKEASDSIFGAINNVPIGAITMGLSTIMQAKRIVMIAFGGEKASSVYDVVEGNEPDTIASHLCNHLNICLHIDRRAAHQLTRISRPWLVTHCEWNDKLIRRAIVHLCQKIDKPILKLTNKDYQDNHLEELLSIYNSAYNVNIRVFNDLQHTITGWPGGKPNTDDTNRPEKAFPYPKKIAIFSPHPDDDIISMGGTFRRLIEQNHDVYVVYETSGNIAVNDEDVIRYISLFENIRQRYDSTNAILKVKYDKILRFLLHGEEIDGVDILDILFVKARIRRQEAIAACRYLGLSANKVRFLDLPFYETGEIRKNPLSEKDIGIIIDYLRELQPDRIFVAGDLADPHGTHKMCLDIVLAAVDELKGEKWLNNNCRIWMYRGAWQEWRIEDIEMAVPLSPEELRTKRNAILRHQSQMESAPFLGNDERLFWQRSEDRNRATAELYRQLGLANYEAIEAFVEYKLLR